MLTREEIEKLSDEDFKSLHGIINSIFIKRYWKTQFQPRETSTAYMLSKMVIGEIKTLKINYIYDDDRKRARAYCGVYDAKWSAQKTNQGIRITRIK